MDRTTHCGGRLAGFRSWESLVTISDGSLSLSFHRGLPCRNYFLTRPLVLLTTSKAPSLAFHASNKRRSVTSDVREGSADYWTVENHMTKPN